MNATTPVNTRRTWSRVLIMGGSIAMLVGALDPMEGSLLILPGSGLVALGTVLDRSGRQLIRYRMSVFILIAIGVGALWGLSQVGGIGGNSKLSMWWGVLVLPYPIGWSLGIWGPDSPRWLLRIGIMAGVWYLALAVIVLLSQGAQHRNHAVTTVIAGLGLLTIGGCIYRLKRQISSRA